MQSNGSALGGIASLFAVILVLGAIGAAIFALSVVLLFSLMAIGAFLAFLAFAGTIVSLIAWKHSFRLGKIFIDSDDAHAFVIRGAFGSVVFPMFVVLLCALFEKPVPWEYGLHLMIAGYTAFSVGFEFLFAIDRDVPYIHPGMIPAQPQLPPTRHTALAAPSNPVFASWDDEEDRA